MNHRTEEIVLQGQVIVWKGKIISAKVPFHTYDFRARRESTSFMSDCVPLRLASHGKTRQEADLSMRNMIKAFLDELIEMGTLDVFLREHGWAKERYRAAASADGSRAKKAPPGAVSWVPPQVFSQLASVPMTR